jgi:hypothetical protein
VRTIPPWLVTLTATFRAPPAGLSHERRMTLISAVSGRVYSRLKVIAKSIEPRLPPHRPRARTTPAGIECMDHELEDFRRLGEEMPAGEMVHP